MNRFYLAATASLLALSSSPAWAQDAQGSEEEAQPGDIVVTATRSETLLSKTPIALTAITGEGLRDSGITDARSLNDVVPNFRFTENGDAARISIRGVTSSDTSEKGDPSASFLIDGIYIARPNDTLGSFYDLERVEVLRGPQGTLFGRNTTAGVINLISARPKDKFEASVDASYGNLDSIGVTGMINVPVGEGLGIRAAVNYDRQDSPLIKGAASPISLNPFRNLKSGRLSFGGKLGDNFDFVIRGDYSQSKGANINTLGVGNFFPVANGPSVVAAGLTAAAPRTVTFPGDPVYVRRSSDLQRTLLPAPTFPATRDNKNWGVMGEFAYDFGPVALTYVGSHRETDRNDVRNLVPFGAFNNPAFFFGDFKQDSHELRLAFGKDSRFSGQVGGYFFKEKSFLEFNIGGVVAAVQAGLGGPPNFNGVGFAFAQGPTKADSKAAFGQFSFELTEGLKLTGGIRYTRDLKSRDGRTVIDYNSLANRPANLIPNCNGTRCTLNQNIASRKFTKTTWKFGLDYDAPGLGLIYANVSSGYKAGGFNDGCVTGQGVGCSRSPGQLYFEPENLTAYEAGFKFRLMDNALRLNVSAFHYDYKNLQLSTVDPAPPPGLLTRNAATAKVDGVEFEALIQPSDNDRIDFSVNYTNARYDDFTPSILVNVVGSNGQVIQTSPGVNLQQIVSTNFKGRQLDQAPKWTASAGYTHTFPIGNGGKIDAGVRTRLSSEYFMQDLNILAQFRQPSYTKTDLTLTYTAPKDRFYVQAFAKNLEDNITLASAATGVGAGVAIEEPRTYGVRAGFKF